MMYQENYISEKACNSLLQYIFSGYPEFISEDGKAYDLGSMRGSGAFLAEFITKNFKNHSDNYSYMHFYMGTIWIRDRADLLPFYEYIFKKLNEKNCDWKYSFPRMHVLNLNPLKEDIGNNKHQNYKPEEAVNNEIERRKSDEEVRKFQEKLDTIYKEEWEEAKYRPLNKLVQAYKNVYGDLPDGHPQKGM